MFWIKLKKDWHNDFSNAVNNSSTLYQDKLTYVAPLDLMSVRFKGSPNYSDRAEKVRAIVLHHTGPGDLAHHVKWMRNSKSGVSAHYVVGVSGEIVQLVNTRKKAWHAGSSKAKIDGAVRYNLNSCTIGIEMCNPGILECDGNKFYYEWGRDMVEWKGAKPVTGFIKYPSGQRVSGYYVPYSYEQIKATIGLCKGILNKYPEIDQILTHYEIATPEGRKNDPFGLDVSFIRDKVFDE